MKNIENFDGPDHIKNNDCEVRRTAIDGALILEKHINKENGRVEKYYLIDESAKAIVSFIDIKSLEDSEYIFELIKAHYINKKTNLSDGEIKETIHRLIGNIADMIMDSEKSDITN